MARSDFCAAFSRLLAPDEQEAVRTLLMAPEGLPKGVPMMMAALHMNDPEQRVFAKPYHLADRNPNHRQAGPTVKDWLASIIEGRREGPLQKDLLSPPIGYPLHGGNPSTDYGMGAMGGCKAWLQRSSRSRSRSRSTRTSSGRPAPGAPGSPGLRHDLSKLAATPGAHGRPDARHARAHRAHRNLQ